MVRVGLGLGLGLFFVLHFSVSYFSCCIFPYYIYILNSEITLTMQNIDVTQESTEQLRANKKELEKKLQQKTEEKQIGFDPECT